MFCDDTDNDGCVAVSYVTKTSRWLPYHSQHYCSVINLLSCCLCIDLRRLHTI